MAWCTFWAQVVQMQCGDPKSQDYRTFWNSMILLDLSNDSGEHMALLVKIEDRILELW